ncbi:hypothetical protein NE237_008794 [Protea cynaroides]|uniref:Uncharacterized protein n=1 Tax=Protea cynaroides TaxID=273540 RepID=A0A9Q0R010_9MAGN|nr:hypothetical protein NE237_008794 [Protea cynaroides]
MASPPPLALASHPSPALATLPSSSSVAQRFYGFTGPVSTSTAAAAKKKIKKGETVAEDVDIGEEMPANNFLPVEIEKDVDGYTSGSSSSSSGSSSSGGMGTVLPH